MNDSIMHAMAGAGGGVLAMTATYPLVFLSTRAAVKTQSENKSVYQAVMEVLEREGVLGLYSGLSSSLLGIAVTNGVYYYFYERSKGIFLTGGKKGLTTIESILTGLIAGSATTIISNPLWVVQTSQAVHTMDPNTQTKNLGFLETVQHILAKFGMNVIKARLQAGATKYKSSLNALATILRDEGIEGLYKGMRSKLLQSVLTAAILFAFQRRIFLITKAVSDSC
ncbi:hypothetical protein HHX47_DHR5001066 [Lentinula edodes]|nr:hypothetical protein HHX47_DHR5001066 [Lentinula edodes]